MNEEEIKKELEKVIENEDSIYWLGKNGLKAIQSLLILYEQQKDFMKKNNITPKYRFTMIYKNEYKNHDINRENQHTVSLFAGTLEKALAKLNNIVPNDEYTYKKILDWNAVEILEERKDNE